MMQTLSMQQIADWVHAPLVGADAQVLGISIDSRCLQASELYVALKGDRFDGHDFVGQVERAGAVGLMLERRPSSNLPWIQVPNSRRALGQLAHRYRMQFDLPVVAITGSNGKTTVKEMVRQILQFSNQVCATEGNLNNEIGVPLTLLGVEAQTEVLIVEMGANAPKEIDYLSRLVQPSIALVTGASTAHLAGFGSVEGVAYAKGELYSALAGNAIALLNRDDEYYDYWLGLLKDQSHFSFGLSEQADFHARNIQPAENYFILCTPDAEVPVRLPVVGRHNIFNAVAAAAICHFLDVGVSQIASQLERFQPAPGRLNSFTARGGATLIDDTYNANPASVMAAVEALRALPGEPWMVLGDLAELGQSAERWHREMGQSIRARGICRLFTIGPLSRVTAQAFGPGAQAFESLEDLVSYLQSILTQDICVLVKGSRSSGMERVVHALKASEGCCEC